MMTALTDRAKQFLHGLPLFSGLPEHEITTLLSAGTIRDYTKNQHLFLHGDRAEKFFIIISGCIKIYSETADGEESVISLLIEGNTLGESSIFDGAIYPSSASATEVSEIFEIRADFLKQRAKGSPELTAKIMDILSLQVQNLQREKEHLSVMSTSQRVGCMLLRLSGGMIGKGGTFTLPYDKSLAAANLGMKPETFSRALKELRPLGVSVKGSEVTIENFEKLSGHSCVHCSSMSGSCRGDKRLAPEDTKKTA